MDFLDSQIPRFLPGVLQAISFLFFRKIASGISGSPERLPGVLKADLQKWSLGFLVLNLGTRFVSCSRRSVSCHVYMFLVSKFRAMP